MRQGQSYFCVILEIPPGFTRTDVYNNRFYDEKCDVPLLFLDKMPF